MRSVLSVGDVNVIFIHEQLADCELAGRLAAH